MKTHRWLLALILVFPPLLAEDLLYGLKDSFLATDVGNTAKVGWGILRDPGDEQGWRLPGDFPEGVYQVRFQVRTGSRTPTFSVDFVASYRLLGPERSFAKGVPVHDVEFDLARGTTPKVIHRAPGYVVAKGEIAAREWLYLRPGDVVKLRSKTAYSMVYSMALRAVPGESQQEVALSTDRWASLFRLNEEIEIRATITNWQAVEKVFSISAQVINLEGKEAARWRQRAAVPARTSLKMPVKFQLKRRGAYWLELKLQDEAGKQVLAEVTRGFGAVRPPRPKEMPDDSPFGLHKTDVDPWPEIGAKWNRLWDTGDTWKRIEKAGKGKFDWDTLDRKVADAEHLGVKLLYVFAYTPTWASSPKKETHRAGPARAYAPADIKDWTDFIRVFVTRYRGRIDHYEIWNEPNAGFFKGTTEEYMQLLKSAYRTIKETNPKAAVLGCSGTGEFLGWLKDVFGRGGLEAMDVVSFHTYTTPHMPEAANLPGRLETVRAMLEEHRVRRELWDTEAGLWIAPRRSSRPMTEDGISAMARKDTRPNWKAGWPYRPVTEQNAASHIVRHYVIDLAGGVSKLFWYRAGWRLRTPLNEPTLPAISYAAMTENLNGFRYGRAIDLGASDIQLHIFRNKKESVLVAWTAGEKPRTVAFRTGARPELRDLWGNPAPLERKESLTVLHLDGRPQYVRNVPEDDFDSFRLYGKTLVLSVLDTQTVVDAAEKNVKRASSEAFHGKRQVIALPDPGDTIEWTMGAIPAGEYEVLIDLRTGANSPDDFVKSYRAAVIPKLEGTQKTPPVSFHLPAGIVPERTRWNKNWGLFYARVQTNRNLALRPGDRIRITSTRGWAHVSDLTLRRVKAIKDLSVYRVPRVEEFSRSELPAWKSHALKLVINQKKQVAIGVADPFASINKTDAWKGPEDLSATAWLAHNGASLFIRLEVTDAGSHAPPPEGSSGWSADGAEFFLDMRLPKRVGRSALSEGVAQFFAVPRGKGALQHAPEGTRFSLELGPGGYVELLEISFRAFPGFQPEKGVVFGFDIAIDDADPGKGEKPKRKSQIIWHGTANNFQDPSRYGRMVLE